MIRRVREVCRRTERHIALMMDVKGPEIRTGDLPAPVELKLGQLIDLLPTPGSAQDGVFAVSVNYPLMGRRLWRSAPPSSWTAASSASRC